MPVWTEKFSVGVEALDDQHKELFKLLYDLSEALRMDVDVDLDSALTKMHVYTSFHFSSEEHLLAKYGYADLEQHVEEHERFKAKVDEFKRKYSDNKPKLALEISDWLTEWIESHVMETDKKYADFLAPKVRQ